MRMYGEPWRPMGRKRMPANVRTFLIRMANATFDRTIHQTSHVRLMYVQASVEIIDGDIIRAWADRYYRRYGDMVHGWVRISAELVSEDEVVVTPARARLAPHVRHVRHAPAGGDWAGMGYGRRIVMRYIPYPKTTPTEYIYTTNAIHHSHPGRVRDKERGEWRS